MIHKAESMIYIMGDTHGEFGRIENEIKRYVKQQLDKLGWKVDVVLSYTTPLKHEPVAVLKC